MAVPGKLGGKALTSALRKLASEQHTITDDGTPRTKEEILAEMIWRQALGWTEVTRDANGTRQEIKHPPVAWCQQYLYERLDGKAPQAVTDIESGLKAADKVRELARERLNGMAKAVAGPPKFVPK